MFKSLPLMIVATVCLNAATISTVVSSLVAQTAANTVATFEDVAGDTPTPVTSAGVSFSTGGSTTRVVSNFFHLSYSSWLGLVGSSPNLLGSINLEVPTSIPSGSVSVTLATGSQTSNSGNLAVE